MKTRKPILRKFVVVPVDFSGIEEVEDPASEGEILDGGVVQAGEITEVLIPSEDDADVIDGGEVSVRNRIAVTVLSVWIVWVIVGLVTFAMTGNPVLLLSSSALMSVPLYRVLGHYF